MEFHAPETGRLSDWLRPGAWVHRLLLGLGQAVVVVDVAGEALLVTPEAENLLGPAACGLGPAGWPDICGCFLPDTLTPYPPHRLPAARALRGESMGGEVVYIRNGVDPAGRWAEVTAFALRDGAGEVEGAAVLLRDCTDHRRVIHRVSATLAERGVSKRALPGEGANCLPVVEALLRQYEWVHSALQQSADSVFVSDRAGVIEYVNPGFTRATGYTPEEALGRTPRLLKSGKHPEEFYRDLWGKLLSGSSFSGVVVNRKKSGELFSAQQSISPIRDEAGAITHFVSVLRDVTDLLKGQEHEFQMQLAREIQERFYGAAVDLPGYDIAGATVQMQEVGGDYFDFIPMERGCLGIVVADVTGHGFGAALVMAETRAYLRALCSRGSDLGEILTRINRWLAEDLPDNRFVTLFMAKLDPAARTLVYASAGHVPGILVDGAAQVRDRLSSLDPPLGLFGERAFGQSGTLHLREGDVLFLMTDGVLETLDRNGEEFGVEGAVRYLRAHLQKPSRQILQGLQSFVRTFIPSEAVQDDVTGVVVKVGPPPPPPA